MTDETRAALTGVAKTLDRALAHHQARDRHDAEVALARLVAYSPITQAIDDALDIVRRLLDAAPTA
ncbi:hypothetical protein SAMN04488074_109226 [Lentzea albidocapillata subsp. violacea]|uniref:Uncharacterized protein n=1 Tax=Lentzea albidocapillata subsp. violacea TaxID=128104 RepID=A0A1G9I1F2_9PSEU|nr:hypothetical protein [Lentzea albidocapillata]SDL18653.1 hypothetical protein SAMN04488074_109226 [Lentzea albidocapillata subsp. violacea]